MASSKAVREIQKPEIPNPNLHSHTPAQKWLLLKGPTSKIGSKKFGFWIGGGLGEVGLGNVVAGRARFPLGSLWTHQHGRVGGFERRWGIIWSKARIMSRLCCSSWPQFQFSAIQCSGGAIEIIWVHERLVLIWLQLFWLQRKWPLNSEQQFQDMRGEAGGSRVTNGHCSRSWVKVVSVHDSSFA